MTPLRLRIKELREAAGLTQGELAKRARIRQATLSAIEAETTTRIDFEVLEALAEALGVAPGYLIEKTDRKRK